MSDMLDKLQKAMAIVNGEQDNLCKALMVLSASKAITILPRSDALIQKPVIVVPQQMYDRMIKLSVPKEDAK